MKNRNRFKIKIKFIGAEYIEAYEAASYEFEYGFFIFTDVNEAVTIIPATAIIYVGVEANDANKKTESD